MDRPRCGLCRDVVGVYEPAYLLLPDGTGCSGSLLTFGEALDEPGSVVMHESCSLEAFPEGERGPHPPQS